MKNIILATILVAGMSSTAIAADLETDVDESVFGWGGLYGGIEVGFGRADGALVENPLGGFGGLPFDIDAKGAVYGITAGYNWQLENNFVFGIEASYSRSDINQSDVVGGATTEGTLEDIFTVGPRLGFAFDRLLVYVESGYANASVDFEAAAGGASFASTERASGVFFGAGVDFAITDNILVGFEYNRVDFSDYSFSDNVTGFGPAGIDLDDLEGDIFKARLLYKF